MRKLFLILVLVGFVIGTASVTNAKGLNKIAPTGKFEIIGSVVVEYQPNVIGDNFSLNTFRAERKKGMFFDRKITDENFSQSMADIAPGMKKRIYLVRQVRNQVYTTTEALEFIQEQEGGERPTLAWALMFQTQHGLAWEQPTAIFTEKNIPGKRGGTLIPFIDNELGGVSLVCQEYPWETIDFIFMVDEPVKEKAEAEATVTATTSID